VRLLRKLLAPVAGIVAAVLAFLAKAPPSMVGVSAAAIAQLAANLVATDRDRTA
jgi:hypothetical protein